MTLTRIEKRRPRRTRPRERGVIFIAALGITVILSALILVFAQRMRVEAMTSANRSAYTEADAIEMGAEKWALAVIESNTGDAGTITGTAAEALQVGDGYFWVIRVNPNTDGQYDFGITDESSKININSPDTSTLETELLGMSAMTQEVADSIVDWRSGGNDSSYYSSLPDPYVSKGGNYESLEELLLINNVTPDLLWGIDRNRNGIIDASEQAKANSGSAFGGDLTTELGIGPYLTAVPPSMDTRTAIRTFGSGRTINQNAITAFLRNNAKITDGSMITAIANKIASALQTRAPTSMADLQQAGNFTIDQFKLFAEFLKTSRAQTATLVNPGTASRVTLKAIGFSDSQCDQIIAARSGADLTTLQWLFTTLDVQTAAKYIEQLSAKSAYFSADIVAVSGDGRAFKRVRIVVDGSTTPAKILYRKDLTDLGWPLPPEIQTSMRGNKGVLTGFGSTNTTSGGSGTHVNTTGSGF